MNVLTDIKPLLTTLLDAAPGHLLVATILAGCLIGTTFFIQDPRVRRAASLAALLVFIVPLPDLLPERSVATLQVPQFTFDDTAAELPATAAGPSTSIDPIVIIALVWFAIAGLLVLRTLLSFRDRNLALRELAEDVAERLGVPRDVPVRVNAGSEGPRVTGLFRPAIIVPAPLLDPEREDELRAVLLHELAHVRQKDNLWSAVSALVTSLFWFHPFAWIAALRFRAFSEVACDAAVIEAGVPLTTYLESLRKVIADAPYERTAQIALGGGSLKERIRIMKSSTSPMSRLAARAVIVTLVVVTLGTGLSLRALTGDEPGTIQLPGDAENVTAYRIESEIVPLEDGRLQADLVVIDLASGRVLSMPRVRFAAGEPAVIVTGQDDETMQLQVELTPSPNERSYDARIELERGTERFDKQLSIEIGGPSTPAPPIDLKLTDAKLADVLDLFSKLLAVDLIVAADIDQELVTVELKGVPWDKALDEVLQSSGLDWRKIGDLLIVAGPGDGAIRPQAPRKPKMSPASATTDPRIQPPTVLERVQPEYPMEARDAGLEGSVVLELTVGEDGILQDVKVKRPLEMGLTESAVEAVRQWKFSPATIEGRAVPFIYHVQIKFSLSESS